MLNMFYQKLRLEKTTHRLFFWIILFALVSGMVLLLLYKNLDRQNRFEAMDELLTQSLESQQTIVESWVDKRMNEVIHLAEMEETKMLDYDAMGNLFQYHAAYLAEVDAFVFLDEKGHVILDSNLEVPVIHSDVSLRDRDYFQAGEAGERYMSDIVISKSNHNPVVIFSSPVETVDGEFGGVVFGSISLSTMSELLQNTALGETGYVTFVDREGTVLSEHSGETSSLSSTLDTKLLSSALAGDIQEEPYENSEGKLVIGRYLPLVDDRFFLIHEIEVDEILQPHYELGNLITIIASVTVILGMLLLFIVIRTNTHSLVYFTKAIQHVTKGNYDFEINEKMYKKSPSEIRVMMDVYQEMTEKIQRNKQELVRLSEVDDLTGIYNRRMFNMFMKNAWEVAYERQKPLSLAFIDIDFFKQLNDAFGHATGDEMLIEVVRTIENGLAGSGGTLFRYGGEEFVVLFPNTDKQTAYANGECMRESIETKNLLHKDDSPVTISVGITGTIPQSVEGTSAFIKEADEALYKAKEAGRNRVVATNVH